VSLEAARQLLRRGGRIAFPPGLGEPDIVAELPVLLAGADNADVLIPWRTRRQELTFSPSVRIHALFPGGRANGTDYTPVSLNSLPTLIGRGGELALDVAVVRVGPQDSRGRHNVGPSATLTAELASVARAVIAEIDSELPKTCGTTYVPAERVTVAIEANQPLELPPEQRAVMYPAYHAKLAEHIAELIPNGAHIQFGLGNTAQALLTAFADHRSLRLHAGLLGASFFPLLESHALDRDWVIPVGEAFGPPSLMGYIDFNEGMDFQSTRTLHDPRGLATHGLFHTVNSVLSVDLLGRASCEGSALEPVGGIGGLTGFLEGARLSEGGRNILVLASTTRTGRSRIVARLPSEEVSIPTYLIDCVATEWGVASFRGANRREIAERLIAIAHPDTRADLEKPLPARIGEDQID
jgi:acyl-CoA hydrolase